MAPGQRQIYPQSSHLRLNGGYWDNEPEQPAARLGIQKQTSAHAFDERTETDYSGIVIDLGAAYNE